MFAPPAADFQGPSAPPASMFDNMPGYEGTVAGGGGTVFSRAYCNMNTLTVAVVTWLHFLTWMKSF